MAGFDGSLALTLDFGEEPAVVTTTVHAGRRGLRLAPPARRLAGPDKYRILERRRHRAQITARRVLELLDSER